MKEKLFGILAAVLAVLGIFFFGGTALKILGIGLLAVGILLAFVIAAALFANKDTTDASDKTEISKFVTDQRAGLTKSKSKAAVLKMDLDRYTSKIASEDRKIAQCMENAEKFVKAGEDDRAKEELQKKKGFEKSRETLVRAKDECLASYEEIMKAIEQMEESVSGLEKRRDDTFNKLKMADAIDAANRYDENAAAVDKELEELAARNDKLSKF